MVNDETYKGELFGGGDLSRATFWTGLRPDTLDGTLGWTMDCGSGRLVADLIADRRPNIEHEDLSIARYASLHSA